ncbi:serine O-acetyltransferase [Calothrix sp. PCC 7507]|uniref:serine O-acetyltransferase n=1 Tax=Calothrix sp. PCC 7507 TaxID=99598 RepID=UPI00029EE6BD|nr:serine O-acetyltransferase [Calothrix sp. PCC 7507]AFY32696.1 serine acetyltransferase [Calothrix sp. PCC 7507]
MPSKSADNNINNYNIKKVMMSDLKADMTQCNSKKHSFWTMLNDLKADIARYIEYENTSWIFLLLTKRGLWATFQYRVSRWVHLSVHIPILRQMLKAFCLFWRLFIEIVMGIELANRAEIGKGLYIAHAQGIIIHCDAKIGEYCNLSHNVTIGVAGRGDKRGVPKLGNRVFIGSGAQIIGSIAIGDDVAIGANAVVTKDLPDNAVAVGVPAKVISYEGSKDFIIYRQSSDC